MPLPTFFQRRAYFVLLQLGGESTAAQVTLEHKSKDISQAVRMFLGLELQEIAASSWVQGTSHFSIVVSHGHEMGAEACALPNCAAYLQLL